uniref:Uncharacterized protein n=1 Tax=Anguilla anguilla TaxID=7936 RepID=A0A0E9S0F8_ANGAN
MLSHHFALHTHTPTQAFLNNSSFDC